MNKSATTKPVFLSLGSNTGNRAANLRDAIAHLSGIMCVLAVSSLYETEPVEFTGQPWFLNCAVSGETADPPEHLMHNLLSIEKQMGRKRTQPKGPRKIDIDILFYGDEMVDTPDLKIPHPAMHQRRFVLAPLAEIAPDFRHPVLKKSVRELLEELPPGQVVSKV